MTQHSQLLKFRIAYEVILRRGYIFFYDRNIAGEINSNEWACGSALLSHI